jgi:prephenate dehydrogenase
VRLAVIGVGLIGGSFALALKKAGKVSHVVGAGRNRANLDLARERGILDSIAPDAGTAARDADVVLVAAPVAQFAAIFAALAPALKREAIVSDAGSTKRDVVAAARAALGAKIGQFVPAHPVAGAETSGGVGSLRRAHHAPGAGGARRGARRGEPPAASPGLRAGARHRAARQRRAALLVCRRRLP